MVCLICSFPCNAITPSKTISRYIGVSKEESFTGTAAGSTDIEFFSLVVVTLLGSKIVAVRTKRMSLLSKPSCGVAISKCCGFR